MNALVLFDYAVVPADASQMVREASVRIKLRMGRTAQDIIEIGRDLIEVKRRIGHGNFLPWIEAEFGMSRQTAERFIQAHEAFGDKMLTVSTLPPTVLYALAAPSTPDEVRTEVVNRVEQGGSVSVAEVKALRDKIAEKDDKLRKIKSQKEATDSHNTRLIEEIRQRSAEKTRFADQVEHLTEELRRATEANTITVMPESVMFDGQVDEGNSTPDIEPWKLLFRQFWNAAPVEACDWMRRLVNETHTPIDGETA